MSKITYEKAQEELNEILAQLERDEMGIDDLNKKLKRAAELINFCKIKLRETESSINELMDNLNSDDK